MLTDYINPPKPYFGPPPATLSFLTSETHAPAPAPTIEPIIREVSLFEYHDRYANHSPGDSELWLRLFMYADSQIHQDCATMLEYIRNTGAVLQANEQYGYVIRPVIGVLGWSSMEEYERERLPLMRWQMDVIRILKRLEEL